LPRTSLTVTLTRTSLTVTLGGTLTITCLVTFTACAVSRNHL
uniref:K1 glycoprotein n=1 Tax=Haemonchus placei TaxID=6290 RepID=A0A0N4WCK7_HAEPC